MHYNELLDVNQRLRPQVTGTRRMSLHMLTLIDQADQFTGVPRGTAKPLRFFGRFQEAEPMCRETRRGRLPPSLPDLTAAP
jgi:hypothetical protein